MMFLIEINGRWCCWYHWVTILCVTAVVYWKVWLILGVGQFIRNFLVFLCFRGFFLSFSWHFGCVLFFTVWRDLSLLFRLVLILWGYWWDATFSLFLHWCISFLSCFRSRLFALFGLFRSCFTFSIFSGFTVARTFVIFRGLFLFCSCYIKRCTCLLPLPAIFCFILRIIFGFSSGGELGRAALLTVVELERMMVSFLGLDLLLVLEVGLEVGEVGCLLVFSGRSLEGERQDMVNYCLHCYLMWYQVYL